jgi:FkbM family methyltransferase
VFERSFHSFVNLVDRALPARLKKQIKKTSPGLVDGFYRQITRFTSDRVVPVRIQSGRLNGRRFFCSLRHQRSCYLGNFEPQKEAVLAEYLSPGKVMFDVGGHIGYFSLIAATLVQPEGSIIAFEPSPQNASQFRQNLEVNPDLARRVRLEEVAVSDAPGTAAFEEGENSYIGHLTTDSDTTTQSAAAVRVRTVALDSFADAEALWPDFVKVDAEGAESMIFRGMDKILTTSRPTLLVEIHDRSSYLDLLTLLARQNYVARRLGFAETFSGAPGYTPDTEYLAVAAAPQ